MRWQGSVAHGGFDLGDRSNSSGAPSNPTCAENDADRLEAFLDQYGVALLAYARSISASAVDADDVYQQMLEAMLTSPPATEHGYQLYVWARRVIANEAISVHRARARKPEVALSDTHPPGGSAVQDPSEVLSEMELSSALSEALRRLRPDHARCLILRAEGFNYSKISELTGFSYAKVNRCLSEGRASLRNQFARINEGQDCARLSGALSAYADGSTSTSSRVDVELHLKNCLACQATLREYRSVPHRVATAFPLGFTVEASTGIHERIELWAQKAVDGTQTVWANVQEQVALRFAPIYQSAELVTAKNTVIAVSVTASIAAGTAGVTTVMRDSQSPPNDRANSAQQSKRQQVLPTSPTEVPADGADVDAQQQASPAPTEATAADVETPGYGRQAPKEPPYSQPASGHSAPVDDAVNSPEREDSVEYSGSSDSLPGLAP